MTGPGARRRAVAVLVVATVVALGAPACSSGDGSSGPGTAPTAPTGTAAATPSASALPSGAATDPSVASSAPAPTLRATATRSNLFESNRAFRLELDQDDGPAIETVSLRLDSELFEPVDPEVRDMELGAGSHVLVPLHYGPAACDAPPDAGLGVVVVTTTTGEQRVPLESYPDGLVGGLHERECRVEAAAEAVDLSFGTDWERVSPRAATGTLVLSPGPDRRVEVVSVGGNIVFGLTTATTLPATLDAGVVELPVRMAANRCDRHALVEAKRKYVSAVVVAVDGDEPVTLEVEATGSVLALFQELLARCMELPESG